METESYNLIYEHTLGILSSEVKFTFGTFYDQL